MLSSSEGEVFSSGLSLWLQLSESYKGLSEELRLHRNNIRIRIVNHQTDLCHRMHKAVSLIIGFT